MSGLLPAALVVAIAAPEVHGARLWEAWATVMVRPPGVAAPAAGTLDADRHLNDLVQIAKSRTVIERSAETLNRLGVPHPERLLPTLVVKPIPRSNTLTIKVTAETEIDAKAAADVIAVEFARYYAELTGEQETGAKGSASTIVVVDPAKARPVPPPRWQGATLFILRFGGIGFAVGLITGLALGFRLCRRRYRTNSN